MSHATLTHFHFHFRNLPETSVFTPHHHPRYFAVSCRPIVAENVARIIVIAFFLSVCLTPAVVSVIVALTKNDKRLLYNYYYIVHATRKILLLKSLTIVSLISRQIIISSRRVFRPRPRRRIAIIIIIIKYYYYLTSCSPFLTRHYVRLIDL